MSFINASVSYDRSSDAESIESDPYGTFKLSFVKVSAQLLAGSGILELIESILGFIHQETVILLCRYLFRDVDDCLDLRVTRTCSDTDEIVAHVDNFCTEIIVIGCKS